MTRHLSKSSTQKKSIKQYKSITAWRANSIPPARFLLNRMRNGCSAVERWKCTAAVICDLYQWNEFLLSDKAQHRAHLEVMQLYIEQILFLVRTVYQYSPCRITLRCSTTQCNAFGKANASTKSKSQYFTNNYCYFKYRTDEDTGHKIYQVASRTLTTKLVQQHIYKLQQSGGNNDIKINNWVAGSSYRAQSLPANLCSKPVLKVP